MRTKIVILAGLFGLATASRAEGVLSGMNATAALDLVTPLYSTEEHGEGFRVLPRSAEFMLYGPIDHLFDGVINFAGHTEDGEFHFELHEGYVESSKLIGNSRFKLGKFFLGVGRLNQYHQHDWNFIDAPLAHRAFFAEEGAADTGLEYSYLLPTDHFFEITAGVTSGYCYGHCHDGGERPERALMYVHPVTYFDVSDLAGLQVGLSYLNRADISMGTVQLVGFDTVYKKREGKLLRWLHQSEGYLELASPAGESVQRRVGGYHLTQYGFSPQWFAGLRFDAFSDLSKTFVTTGESRGDFDYAATGVLTWKPSEFANVKFSYGAHVDTTEGDADQISHLAQLQFVFLLGAHPAHDF